jgi:adenosylcobinamide kinase/adenosylcobinamide-phosphate guanylyltransferase
MSKTVLISGGSRSGKSSYALELARELAPGPRLYFIATAQPLDDEMRARIEHHRAARSDDLVTLEEPIKLLDQIAGLNGKADVLVIDCLTLWISNLMGADWGDASVLAAADALSRALAAAAFPTVVVTDEVGSGVVPEYPAGRRFRDLLGWTNQKVGKVADQIILMVAGHPLVVKPKR